MAKSAADRLMAQFVSANVDLQRLSAHTRNVSLPYLESLKEELETAIRSAGLDEAVRSSVKFQRQQELLEDVNRTIDTAYRKTSKSLTSELVDIASFEADQTARLTHRVIGVNLLRKLPPPAVLKSLARDPVVLGAPASAWWDKQKSDLKLQFMSQVRMGVAAGETNDDLVRRVRGRVVGRRVVEIDGKKRSIRVFSGGVMDVSTRNAESLVRTSVQSVANATHDRVFRENEDVVKGMQAVVTLDLRTSEICMARSGGAWDLDGEPLPDSPVQEHYPGPPPWHYGCRTIIIPVLRSWEELSGIKGIPEPPVGTRASMDGQVAGDLGYEDWLRQQSESRQLEVLGPGRKELWEKGEITLADLIDQSGNPVSLSRLRRDN